MESNADVSTEKHHRPDPPSDEAYEKTVAMFEQLDFDKSSSPMTAEQANNFSVFLGGLRPGMGLIGNEQEEDHLYEKLQENTRESEQAKQAENSNAKQSGDEGMASAAAAAPATIASATTPATTQGAPADETAAIDSEHDGGLLDDVATTVTSVVKYKAKRKKAQFEVDEEDEANQEDLGDYEGLQYSCDIIITNNDRGFHVCEYFGPSWAKLIRTLHSTVPMALPEHMSIVPHTYQLKGAAQIDWACKGPFQGIMIGDAMGLGKTLQAILAMWLCRDEPGMSLVVAPASLCSQWVRSIETSWEEGYGLRAIRLDNSSMTVSQLIAGGYDVAVTSYEFVEQNGRPKLAFSEAVNAFSNDQEGRIPKPSRPTTALHSDVGEIMGIPFKRVILDEAHRVNKRNKVRHDAIKRLPAQAFVMLSGTLPHNKWHNMSGYLDYLKGHAFDTHEKFLHTFSTRDEYGRPDSPNETQLRRLQIFLQAMLVARPQGILKLKNCRCLSFKFQLRESCNHTAKHYFTLYKEHVIRETRRKESQGARTDGDGGLGAFLFLFYAQLASVHPMLLEEALAGRIELEDEDIEDPDDDIIAKPKGKGAGVEKDDWQRRLRGREQLCQESSRVIYFLRLFSWLRKNYPKRKIVVFSRLVVFLDIIAEALRRTFGIDALRFDGTVRPSKRSDVEREFKFTDENVPMLITSGVGGEGLNITCASLVVQLEPWWNRSVERQAVHRVYRQGQDEDVLYIRMEGRTEVDQEILLTANKKTLINEELMEPLVRRHDEEPADIELLDELGDLPMQFDEFMPGYAA